jgi:hypothetical protein
MTKLDWEKDRRDHLQKEYPTDLPRDPRDAPVIRAVKPPVLRDVKRATGELKLLLQTRRIDQLNVAATRLRALVLEWTTQTGQSSLEIQNAKTVLSHADQHLRRFKPTKRQLTIGPPLKKPVRRQLERAPARVSGSEAAALRQAALAQALIAFNPQFQQIAMLLAGSEEEARRIESDLREQFTGLEHSMDCPKCTTPTKWKNLKRHLARQHGLVPEIEPSTAAIGDRSGD